MKNCIQVQVPQKRKIYWQKNTGLLARFSVLVMTGIIVLGICSANAQTFNFNGLNYSIDYSTIPATAQVASNTNFSGNAVIAPTVVFSGDEYEVTTIGVGAFLFSPNLTSVEIPNTVTTIGGLAFFGCSGLTSITIPNSVTTIQNSAFGECVGLTSVVLPNSVTTLGMSVFSACSNLVSVTLPNSITSMGSTVFSSCINLVSVNIPTSLSTIPFATFSNCESLTTIQIPSAVTVIGGYAFANCSSFSTINIPSSVTSIGDFAFGNCFALSSVTVNWPMPLAITDQIFYDVNLSNVTLNVPAGTQSFYHSAPIWEEFNPIVEQATSCVTVQGIHVISNCGPITWIDGETYFSSNNTASFLLVGAAQNGCDSLVTLNFTLWPCTQLQAGSCGAINVTGNQLLFATNVNAPVYRFRFTGPNNGGPGWNNNQFVVDRPNRYVYFNHLVPGFQFGATYSVEVAVADGFGNFGPYGNVCSVTTVPLAAAPLTQIQTSQCGASVNGNTLIFANQIFDAQGYRFRITGPNNGGSGWNNNVFILDRTSRNFYFSWLVPGATPGATFSVEVAYLQNDGVTYSPYGAACNITLIAPTTQIQASQCGITNLAQNTLVFANQVFDAQGYRFRVTGPNNGGAGWVNDQFVFNRPSRDFTFQWNVPGSIAGAAYQVEVAYLTNDGVTYSAYGSMCTVELFAPNAKPENTNNDIFVDNKIMNVVEFGANASHNPFTTDFGIQVLNANDSEAINVVIYDMSGKLIERNAVNPMDIETARFGANLASGMYMIEVRQGSNQAVLRQVKN